MQTQKVSVCNIVLKHESSPKFPLCLPFLLRSNMAAEPLNSPSVVHDPGLTSPGFFYPPPPSPILLSSLSPLSVLVDKGMMYMG